MSENHQIKNNIVFIVGRGRSGTTLLAKMLNQHDGLYFPHEGLFIINLVGKFGKMTFTSDADYSMFTKNLFLDIRMSRWFRSPDELMNALLSERPLTFSEVCRCVYRTSAKSIMGKEKLIWIGDKNPHYSLCLPELRAVFPDAKFIVLTRDFRSNIRSFLSVPFDLDSPYGLAARWVSFNTRLLAFMNQHPAACFHVKMEDLVSNSSDELRKICAFLGVSFDASLLSPKPLPNEEPLDWHGGLHKAVDASKAEATADVTPEWESFCQAKCSQIAERLGYEINSNSTSKKSLMAELEYWKGMHLTWIEKRMDKLPYQVRLYVKNNYLKSRNAFTENELSRSERHQQEL
ncbi:MAG: sulfotransferase [Cryomorphaceae bacterium]